MDPEPLSGYLDADSDIEQLEPRSRRTDVQRQLKHLAAWWSVLCWFPLFVLAMSTYYACFAWQQSTEQLNY